MGAVVGRIEFLRQAIEAVHRLHGLVGPFADPAVLRIVPLYLLVFAWFAYRWTSRSRRRRRTSPRDRLRVGEGLLRPFGAAATLALALLFAVARVAGRSTFHSGRRF